MPELTAESDDMFVGYSSRIDPSNLQPNYLQYSQNMRLQRGVAKPRLGTKRLTDFSLESQTMVGSGQWIDSDGNDNIILVFTDRFYIYRPPQNGLSEFLSPAYNFPSNRNIIKGGVCDVVQALDKIYIFRGAETKKRLGTGTSSTTNSIIISHPAIPAGGTVTAEAIFTNGFSPNFGGGEEVTFFNIDSAAHIYLRNSFVITVVSIAGNVLFQVTNNTSSHINAVHNLRACCVAVKPPFVWDTKSMIWQDLNPTTNPVLIAPQVAIAGSAETHGLTQANGSVPPADFGLYYQNRIVACISKTQIAVSDILSDVFDFTFNNFIINQGGNDSIVGVLPWIENQFLVFMNKSVYVAYLEPTTYGVGGLPGANSSLTVVSTEVGCLSRKSIVSAGQYVFFLSGKGIYLLSPQLDLKLVGNTLPLSEPIADIFDEVNFSAIKGACACYFSNRFYIALPTNDSLRNNIVLVYNTLNQAWESKDTYPDGMWIDDLNIASYLNQKRMFILTRFNPPSFFPPDPGNFGGVFVTEEYVGGDQYDSSQGTPVLPFVLPATIASFAPVLVPIEAYVITREYAFKTLNEKRFSRGEFQFTNSVNDFVRISTRTYDPDVYEEILGYKFNGQADGTLRPRIGARGTSIDVRVDFVTGNPALKSISINAITANRAMVSQE
jgi:hypothetical protein